MPNGPAKIDQDIMRWMWLNGVRTGLIAARFGCSKAAISRCARALDLPKRDIAGALLDSPTKTAEVIPKYQKPSSAPAPVRLAPRYSYAVVQELVATRGMTQRQALAEFHKRGEAVVSDKKDDTIMELHAEIDRLNKRLDEAEAALAEARDFIEKRTAAIDELTEELIEIQAGAEVDDEGTPT